MAALRTLISGAIPPVGQRVDLSGPGEAPPEFPGFVAVWTASGTAALALAIAAAIRLRPEIERPAVLLPAYGCPDLVAAAVAVGAAPVLVDLEAGGPGYDPEALAAGWRDEVVAVVAVNFLGIRDRLADIRQLAATHHALLIEDCAQWYPEGQLDADAIVLSFGRGKPVNLLGGGALLAKPLIPLPENPLPASRGGRLARRVAAFHFATRRLPYAWLSSLGGLGIGETRYKPLANLAALDDARLMHLAANARRWLDADRWRERMLDEALPEIAGLRALPLALAARRGRLLRYPVLFDDAGARDEALRRLAARGLGVSGFYGAALPEIADIPASIRQQGPFPQADGFAARLVTLPIHAGVTGADLERICAILRRVAGR